MNYYSLLPRPLTYADHAKERAMSRHIKHAEILRVVRTGKRIAEGERVIHYDLGARIKVVVNWQDMVIVTVVRLSDKQCRKLKEQTQ